MRDSKTKNMNQNKYTEEEARVLVHRSLDEELNSAEQRVLEAVLEQYPALKAELSDLRQMQQLFVQLHPVAQPDFAQQVAEAAMRSPAWYRPLVKSWSAVAAAACVAMILALGFIYYNSGTLETEALLGLEDIQLEDAYVFE